MLYDRERQVTCGKSPCTFMKNINVTVLWKISSLTFKTDMVWKQNTGCRGTQHVKPVSMANGMYSQARRSWIRNIECSMKHVTSICARTWLSTQNTVTATIVFSSGQTMQLPSSSWRWRHYIPPKCLYPSTRSYGVPMWIWCFCTVRKRSTVYHFSFLK
jgi:hypothetical protein